MSFKKGDTVRIKSWKLKRISKKSYLILDIYKAHTGEMQAQFLNHKTMPTYMLVKVNSKLIKDKLGVK